MIAGLAEKRMALAEKMKSLGIEPAPGQKDLAGGAVQVESADGLYYNIADGDVDIQLLVVGPMLKRPGEYAAMFDGYYVIRCDFLLPSPDTEPQTLQRVIDRGMISIMLSKVPHVARRLRIVGGRLNGH